jgi:RHS repeat-associated protein
VLWSATYSVFGKAEIQVETVINNLRFPGQYDDAETGLYYNCFRYYDPKIGRYLRVDPVEFEGGINVFAYVLNNPSTYRDPLGL